MRSETLLRELRETLEDAGLRGAFLVRDLHTGQEVGIEPDLEFPTASLVKVPLALATLERIHRGELDGAQEVEVRPSNDALTSPSIGLGAFRHPARVAVEDLLVLSVTISDNTAAEKLFALTPPDMVSDTLRKLGTTGITVRHTIADLSSMPLKHDPSDTYFAHTLAIEAGTAGRGHSVAMLDVTRASSGSPRAYVDLLQALWRPSTIVSEVAERVRELLAGNMLRHRLAPDFSSDATRWSSKTGTALNLRHEIGVVEHDDGARFAVAALTESRVPASAQPEAEAVMGGVARRLRDHLRASS